MAHDTGCYADCNLAAAEMPSTPIILPPAPEGMRDQLAASDAWAFWRAWHAEALRGTPLPWELQAEIARLPQDVWTLARRSWPRGSPASLPGWS